jgi:hypothetical protein
VPEHAEVVPEHPDVAPEHADIEAAHRDHYAYASGWVGRVLRPCENRVKHGSKAVSEVKASTNERGTDGLHSSHHPIG